MAVKSGAAHEIQALKRKLLLTEQANERLCEQLLDAVPTNWLDPLLTGPDAVIQSPPYNCKDVERLLNHIRARMSKIVISSQNGERERG